MLFLMGHSMGGAEVLLLSLHESQPQPIPRISGVLLESPHFTLHPDAQPNPFTVMAGKLASKVLPKRQLLQKLESKHMCRNPQVCRDWEVDELCHDTGTLEGLTGMLQRAADLTTFGSGRKVEGFGRRTVIGMDQSESESVPVWIGHGTEDRVTSCVTSQSVFDKLDVKDKTLKLYGGAYHKLHAEPEGVAEEFANDVANWILERRGAGRRVQGDDVRPKL
jgi:acylglycerol lipase